jgi:hypothetical protein
MNELVFEGRFYCLKPIKSLIHDRCPVICSYRGFVCCFKTAKCAFYRSKTLGCYKIRMRRHRPIRQVDRFGLNFLDEGAAHCDQSGLCRRPKSQPIRRHKD